MRPYRHLCSRVPQAAGGAHSKSAIGLPSAAAAALGLSAPEHLRGSRVAALRRPAPRNSSAGETSRYSSGGCGCAGMGRLLSA